MNLDYTPQRFQELVEYAGRIVSRFYGRAEERKVFPGKTPAEVQSLFDEPLPEQGTDPGNLLEIVERDVFETSTLNIGPHFYGYITGGGNQAAILGEMIKAALNQNNLKWHSSPASTELEKLAVRWVAEFVGYPTECAGVLLGGGSVANFESLAVARKVKAPAGISEVGMYNAPPMTIYVSEEGHSSFDKAVDMLGIGKRYLRKIPVDDRFRIDPVQLEERIVADRKAGLKPICAIGIAGTTNTGAVDDLQALAEVCRKHDLWFHVDAAYGGPAAALEGTGAMFRGMAQADSLVVNPHKWLYVPFGAACVLVRNGEQLRRTFSAIPDYLKSDEGTAGDGGGGGRTDLMEYNLPLTKDFKALKVWMTLKAYGARRLREMIRADIDKAGYLAARIDADPRFERMAPVPLSIVCFRYLAGGRTGPELDQLNNRIIREIEGDGRIFLTGTRIGDRTALRACIINHRTGETHLDRMLEVIAEIGGRTAG